MAEAENEEANETGERQTRFRARAILDKASLLPGVTLNDARYEHYIVKYDREHRLLMQSIVIGNGPLGLAGKVKEAVDLLNEVYLNCNRA